MITVPIPKRMRALGKDKRGYPIPFTVLRDTDNTPSFPVLDTSRQRRCSHEKRCTICGNRLDRILWFVGGPQAAFSPNGAYLDSAMHHDCMTYALQVCPYLAAPVYSGRLDISLIDPDKVPKDTVLVKNPEMIEARPPVFVAVATLDFVIIPGIMGGDSMQPMRPYLEIEFWRQGVKLTEAEGMERIRAAVEAARGSVTITP